MAVAFEAYATKNGCYKANKKMPKGKAEGIVVHSTGANNPTLKRYVNAPDICGENIYKNYYDHPDWEACPHAVIGKDKGSNVKAAQLLPYDICCWNAGQGKKGSYNYSPAYLQFEICEDGLDDPEYFEQAFDLAAKLCYEWCKAYNIPISKIVSHKEAHAQGYACNHGDPENWLSKFGKDMNWFRKKVEDLGKKAAATKPATDKTYVVVGTKVCKNTAALTTAKNQLKALGYEHIVVEAK